VSGSHDNPSCILFCIAVVREAVKPGEATCRRTLLNRHFQASRSADMASDRMVPDPFVGKARQTWGRLEDAFYGIVGAGPGRLPSPFPPGHLVGMCLRIVPRRVAVTKLDGTEMEGYRIGRLCGWPRYCHLRGGLEHSRRHSGLLPVLPFARAQILS
jgi:hypothetical protein